MLLQADLLALHQVRLVLRKKNYGAWSGSQMPDIPGCARILTHSCPPYDSLLHQRYFHAKVDLHEVESKDPEVG